MSLIDLNPTDSNLSTLPYYNETNFSPVVSGNNLSNLGYACDVSEDNTIVAVSQPNYFAQRASSTASIEYVFIYEQVSEVWTNEQTLTNPGSNGDSFGISLALSKTNGEFLAVGSLIHTVYIYQSNLNSPPTYTLVNTLAFGSDNFGFNVKLNPAGDTLFVTDILGNYFEYSTTDDWASESLDYTVATAAGYTNSTAGQIGFSVSDDRVAVRGLPLFPVGSPTTATGRVDVMLNGSIVQSITGSVSGGRWGGAVAISSNGNYIAIGETAVAMMNTNEQYTSGLVYIYVLSGGTYTLEAIIEPSDVSAAAASVSGSFGYSLALNSLGNFLIIGDVFSSDLQGDCYMFERNDDVWSLEQNSFASIISTSATVTLTSSNNTLQFTFVSDLILRTATVPVGTFNGFDLATAIELALEAQSGSWTVTFSYVTGFFTLTTTSGNVSIEFNALFSVLGFIEKVFDDTSYTSVEFAEEIAFTGSLVGNCVSISDQLVSTIVVGKPGTNISEGSFAICELSTTSIVRNERLIIDVNENIALGVRKNNDNGYIAEFDTINEQIRFTSDLHLDGNLDMTGSVINVEDITGTNGMTLTGGQNPGNDLILQSTTDPTEGKVCVAGTSNTSSSTTGALKVNGGVGIQGDVFSTRKNITQLAFQNDSNDAQKDLAFGTLYLETTDIFPGNRGVGTIGYFTLRDKFYLTSDFDQRGATSSDGLNWDYDATLFPPENDQAWTAIAFNNEDDIIYILSYSTADDNLQFAHSFNGGSTWSRFAMPSAENWVSLVYAPDKGTLVATNNTGTDETHFAFSTDDGETWSNPTQAPFSGSNLQWLGLSYSQQLGRFVTLRNGSSDNIGYSSDGDIWEGNETPDSVSISPFSLTWSPDLAKFCAVFFNASVSIDNTRSMTSLDGINWTLSPNTFPEAGVDMRDITWCSEVGLFAAVSSTGSSGRFFTSPDGDNWTQRDTGAVISQTYHFISYSPKMVMTIAFGFGTPPDTQHLLSFLGRPAPNNTIFGHPFDISYTQSTRTFALGPNTTLAVENQIILGDTVTSIKSSGSFGLDESQTNTEITGLLFTGTRSFTIHCFVSINASTDLFSQYNLQGTNESIGGNVWTLVVTRSGVTDPLLTFDIVAGTGQVRYTNSSYTGFLTTNSTIYWDVLANIQ